MRRYNGAIAPRKSHLVRKVSSKKAEKSVMQTPNDLLKDKKIALAVSGSIAAYKAV